MYVDNILIICTLSSAKKDGLSRSRQSRSLRGVLKTQVPVDGSLHIPHFDDYRGRDQPDIMHLMTISTQDGKIIDRMILPIAVQMGHFQNLGYTKTA